MDNKEINVIAESKQTDKSEEIIKKVYTEPQKQITTNEKLKKFLEGKTIKALNQFISSLQKSVEGKTRLDTIMTDNVKPFSKLLEYIENKISKFPPIEQPMRYGNKSFRNWLESVTDEYLILIQQIVPEDQRDHLSIELKPYFLESFGNSKRIDYGTGHELNFICILYILFSKGIFIKDDLASIVHQLFYQYIVLMRKLQTTYMLEPAGSHGVWGLDDYNFMPFIFGASELVKHPEILPKSIHIDRIIEENYDKYFYLGCIKFIKTVKKASNFGEHSPMLNDISNVPSWEKVNKGLPQMYIDEVFKKFPIMQHFYFGHVIKFE